MKLTSIKLGNSKLHRSCGIFDLPTSVCFHNCPGCYAKKAERIYHNVRIFRDKNLALYKQDSELFRQAIIDDITQAAHKIKSFRIHSSGDFFEQEYVYIWSSIIKQFPDISFYAYTKNSAILDFTPLTECRNFNLINSIACDGGYNYGKQDRIDYLQSKGYFLCPDTV